MVAILGGLGAALSWAIATLASSRSSRMIGPISVLGWVMAVGWLAAIGPALLSRPTHLGLPEVAALLSVALGETLAGTTALVLGAIALGVVLAAAERAADPTAGPRLDPGHNRQAAILALAAAGTFSIGLVLAGRLGAEGMPPAWVMLVSRTVGLTVIVLPLVLTRRFRLTRAALPLVILSGLLEVFGGAIYVVAASSGVAVAAVLSSQFAAIAAISAFFLFGERLQRLQVVGVVVIAIGVTALAALQA